MLRGTQVLLGDDAAEYHGLIDVFTETLINHNYLELVVPFIWDAKTFQDKIRGETLDQMWTFEDKKGRVVCLIPEITAIVQQLYNISWSKELPKPIRLFYCSKVFRYERPQAGRLREFTQFGIEILGNITPELEDECIDLLDECLCKYSDEFVLKTGIKRGLGYYIEDGFEAWMSDLQIAGGGKYREGIGWAIGIERLLIAGRENQLLES